MTRNLGNGAASIASDAVMLQNKSASQCLLPVEILDLILKHYYDRFGTMSDLSLTCLHFHQAVHAGKRWQSLSIRNDERAEELLELMHYYKAPRKLECPLLATVKIIFGSSEDQPLHIKLTHLIKLFTESHIGIILRRGVKHFEWASSMTLPSSDLVEQVAPFLESLRIHWRPHIVYRQLSLDTFKQLDTLMVTLDMGQNLNEPRQRVAHSEPLFEAHWPEPLWPIEAFAYRSLRDHPNTDSDEWVERLLETGSVAEDERLWHGLRPIKRLQLERHVSSLLHTGRLIGLGSFAHLEYLSIQIALFDEPFSLALLSCCKTLRALRISSLVLDCHCKRESRRDPREYDCGYRAVDLVHERMRHGRMEALEYYDLDVPEVLCLTETDSLFDFVDESPKLSNWSIDRAARTFVCSYADEAVYFPDLLL